MPSVQKRYNTTLRFYLPAYIFTLCNFLFSSVFYYGIAQTCPQNIDFETGTFNGWTCFTGTVAAVGGMNVMSLSSIGGASASRQTMYTSNPGSGVDEYGGFPINCPNGSGHSIKLGNNMGGGQAEAISYEFTIPANEDVYNLMYNYAVVFQDPDHEEYEQPRMEIEITNVTDNKVISCSSFAFHPYGTPLPGFRVSDNPGTETPVWYKDWTPVSINLDGHAGKTIRLMFKTSDCTFRRHFGYAYIDVNSECSGTFVGATHCPDDTTVKIVAPYGYQRYTWYNSTLTTVVGDAQTLSLTPPPPPGTVYAVKLEPYIGFGCALTMYSKVMDTLVVNANAGEDQLVCNDELVQIGALPKAGLIYKWSPEIGLNNSNISNPLVRPETTTTYFLTTRTVGGGCNSTDTVVVIAARIDNTLALEGSEEFCTGTLDSAVLKVKPVDRIDWYKNSIQIPHDQPVLRVTESGSYHAILHNVFGCSVNTEPKMIDISSIPVADWSLNQQEQCLVNNQFVFNNASTNVIGTMKYKWMLGDGSTAASRNITHNYKRAGNYNVKLIVNTNGVCADTADIPVTVFQNPVADFAIEPVCVNLPFVPVNKTADTLGSTISYLWDFGNGQISTEREPPSRMYDKGGVYPVSLSVSSEQCPFPQNTMLLNLLIDQPRKSLRHPVQYAVINHPVILRSRQFGESILWSPGNFLNTNSGYSPTFNGASDQLYTISITTGTGCVTVDTLFVKTIKDVNILVPTAFTPNNDGKNDFLKPMFMGIERIRHFRIFNRWGQLLFEMNGEHRGWDGLLNGIPQPTQTIVWMVEGIGVDGNTYLKKGTSLLIR